MTAADIIRANREKLGFTREEAALEFGFSPEWWARVERGGKITMATLLTMRLALLIPDDEFEQAVLSATGVAPSFKGIRNTGLDHVTQRWVDAHVTPLKEPTVLLDGGWNTLHYNAAWAALFDGVAPHPHDHPLVNPIRFQLFHKDARKLFVDWEERWIIPSLCQIAHHYYLNHDNPELRALREGISEDHRLEYLFTVVVHKELAERGLDRIFASDGEQREIVGPDGVTPCVLTGFIPWHARAVGYQAFQLSHAVPGKLLLPELSPDVQGSRTAYEAGAPLALARTPDNASGGGGRPPQDRAAYAGYQAIAAQPAHGLTHPDVAITTGQIFHTYRDRLVIGERVGIPQNLLPHLTSIGMSDRKYRDLEGGKMFPTPPQLTNIVKALEIPEPVDRLLYCMVTGGNPPTKAVRGKADFERRAKIWAQRHVDVQSIPTSLEDGQWNVICHNAAFAQLFSHAEATRNHPTKSSFRYVLFHDDARHTLANWYEEWAIPFLVEFGAKLMLHGNSRHPEHAQMLEDIRDDPLLWDALNGPVKAELHSGGAGTGPLIDGGVRRLNLPTPGYCRNNLAANRKRYKVLVTAGAPLFGLTEYGCQTVSLDVQTD
ncbi:helix-turn-helix domain-containing protein [Streptomyces inhibens]|uniref:helix-turn-helix domain-containing protein n=1 Tax=Streptomyces inhibens TaxID=2293571 RepID=UPI000FFB56F9|nr:helix-turn-helix transcriptional regulator [Streptomyces inhibens]